MTSTLPIKHPHRAEPITIRDAHTTCVSIISTGGHQLISHGAFATAPTSLHRELRNSKLQPCYSRRLRRDWFILLYPSSVTLISGPDAEPNDNKVSRKNGKKRSQELLHFTADKPHTISSNTRTKSTHKSIYSPDSLGNYVPVASLPWQTVSFFSFCSSCSQRINMN